MAQGVDSDVLAQPCGLTRALAGLMHRAGRQRLVRVVAREEVAGRSGRLPVPAEDLEQPG